MQHRSSEAHSSPGFLGPLTDTAFVRRAVLERDGALEHSTGDGEATARWRQRVSATLAAYLLRSRPHVAAESTQPRERQARDQPLT